MTRARNRHVIVLVCVLCLCSGLVSPALAAQSVGDSGGEAIQVATKSPIQTAQNQPSSNTSNTSNTTNQNQSSANTPNSSNTTNQNQTSANTSNASNESGVGVGIHSLNKKEANDLLKSKGSQSSQNTQSSINGPSGQTNAQVNEDNGSENKSAKEYTIRVGPMEVPIGEAVAESIQFIVDKTSAGIASLINTFHEYILGLPAPGEATDISSWMNAGGWWTAVYGVYGIMSAIAIALLTPSFMVATDKVDRQERHAYFIELSKAAFFILLGIPVIAFCLHLGNSLTLAVAPKGLDFIASLAGLKELGVGIIFGFILLMSKGSLVAIGIICTMLIHILVYLVVAFWPIFWAFRVQPQSTMKGFGHMGIALFPLLILMKFVQAGILRFLFEIPYGGGAGAIFKLVATTGGLTIALIALPYATVTKLVPGSAMLMENMNRKQKVIHEHEDVNVNVTHTQQVSDEHVGPKSENPDQPTSSWAAGKKPNGYQSTTGPSSENPNPNSFNRGPSTYTGGSISGPNSGSGGRDQSSGGDNDGK